MAESKAVRLLSEERRRKILAILDKDGRVTVDDLVKAFGVSAVTARGDLDALAEVGALVRSHGGAVRRVDPMQDYPIVLKETLHHPEKVRIGRAAASLIKPDQTVILDSGTTTVEVARQLKVLKTKNVTVITNALNIAMELATAPQISVIMIGGILRQTSYSMVGPQAEQTLRSLYADQLFLGVDGFDVEIGPSTPDILEAQLNGLMMKVARMVTVVADSSKFGRRSLSAIGRIEDVHRVITDSEVPPDVVNSIRSHGIEVTII